MSDYHDALNHAVSRENKFGFTVLAFHGSPRYLAIGALLREDDERIASKCQSTGDFLLLDGSYASTASAFTEAVGGGDIHAGPRTKKDNPLGSVNGNEFLPLGLGAFTDSALGFIYRSSNGAFHNPTSTISAWISTSHDSGFTTTNALAFPLAFWANSQATERVMFFFSMLGSITQ